MSVVNLGSQTLTFDYKQPAQAKEFNQQTRGVIKPGFYSDAVATHLANVISVPAFRAYMNVDSTMGILATTSAVIELTAIAPKDYLVMSYTWVDTEQNWIDFEFKVVGDITANDIIICKINYSGSNITSLDTSVRNVGLYDESYNMFCEGNTTINQNLYVIGDIKVGDEGFLSDISVADTVGIKNSANTGDGNLNVNRLISTETTGTSPFSIASTTLNTNLNADLLDGYHATEADTPSRIVVRTAAGLMTGTATKVNITDSNSNSNFRMIWAGTASGSSPVYTTSGITCNPSNNTITATRFYGDVTGDVTGNVTGNLTGIASRCTVNSSDATGPYDLMWASGNNDIYRSTNGNIQCYPHAGQIAATSFNATSKRSAKKEIKPYIDSALEIIDTIDIVSYKFKQGDESTKVGFIADDTDPLLSGPKQDSVDLSSSVGILLKAVQELRAENKELRKRLDKIELEV